MIEVSNRVYNPFPSKQVSRDKEDDEIAIVYLVNVLKSDDCSVKLEQYYNHATLLVESKIDSVIIHVARSYKEHNVPKKELIRFMKIASERVKKTIQKYVPKHVSGVYYIFVGNFAKDHCGFKIANDKTHTAVRIIKRNKDSSNSLIWFIALLNDLTNWIESRTKKLEKYLKENNKNPENDPLYNHLQKLKNKLKTAKRDAENVYKTYYEATPEERSLLILSAGLLRSLGFEVTEETVGTVAKLLAMGLGIKDVIAKLREREEKGETPAELSRKVLSKVAIKDNGGYRVRRSLTTISAQVIHSAIPEEKRITKIRIVKENDFPLTPEHALVAYTAHFLTRRGLAPNWDFFGGICNLLAMKAGLDEKRMDEALTTLQQINPDYPAILLHGKAISDYWRLIYITAYKRRRRRG